jgi:hypothetical protein
MAATVAREEAREAGPRRARVRRAAATCAGPAVIVACVLFALRGFLGPNLTNQHPDVLAFWLPRFAFLGRSIAGGHVPLWNPFEMLGTRYAADPQSGWLSLAPMALFSTLSPGAAMRALIALNPLLAGLGMWWFLRKEGLSRVAATAGGLALSMPMATSTVAISMPFAGAIAWTTVVLIGAAGYRGAARWSGRLAWLALAAFAWGQVATAHMSHGLAIATLLAAAYLLAHTLAADGAAERWRAAARALLFLAVLAPAAAAVLVPHLAMIGGSSLTAGYDALGGALGDIRGLGPSRALIPNGVWAGWPLAIGTAPGAFAGAVTIVALPLALRRAARRPLVWAFGVAAAGAYLATLNALVTAEWYRRVVLALPYGDAYLHNPGRLRYVWLVTAPALAACGVQGLIERPPTRRALAAATLASAGAFLVLPVAAGADPVRLLPLTTGIVVATPVLLAVTSGRLRPVALAALLVVELFGGAIYAQLYRGGTIFTGLESGRRPNLVPQVLRWPDLSEAEFLRPNAFVDILRGTPDRYLTWVPPAAYFEKGYLFTQTPIDWPALEMGRGTLFGVHDTLGYNPVQLVRYWTYIRATNRLRVFYNAAIVNEPSLEDVRLFGARYLIVPQGFPRPLTGDVVASVDGYDLIEVDGWQPRVSVVPAWTVARDPAEAFAAVLEPGFDPAATAVLEEDPGIARTVGAAPGTASYEEVAPEDLRVSVDAPAASIVVVRNSFDQRWSATVDGEPVPVLPTDGFLQGVPVPAGHHEVRLVYRDPAIGRGIALSAVAWGLLAVSLGAAAARERRRR